MIDVEVFFDDTCGFSNRARHWLDALDDVQVVWRPFSLLEQNRDGDGQPVFEQAEQADNVLLIALAVHLGVGADGGDVDGYRERMFDAWHEEPGRLSTEEILGFGQAAGLDGWDHDRAFAALGDQHAAAEQLGVFGTRPSCSMRNTRCSSSSTTYRRLTGCGRIASRRGGAGRGHRCSPPRRASLRPHWSS